MVESDGIEEDLYMSPALVHFTIEKWRMINVGSILSSPPNAKQTQRGSPPAYPDDVVQGAEFKCGNAGLPD